MIHPFNGATYYNSGRANGLGYWSSSFSSLLGAFIWESAGETHPMSYNDMISTGIGGMAFGEAVYRMSSRILDNTATGNGERGARSGRFSWTRYAASTGLSRAKRGASRETPPTRTTSAPFYRDFFAAGVRVTGRGESISDSTQTQAVVELYMDSGSPWENARRKPFDHFDVGVQFNGDDKVPLGRFQIRGDLFSKALGGRATQSTRSRSSSISITSTTTPTSSAARVSAGALFAVPAFAVGGNPDSPRPERHDSRAVNSEYAYIVETEEQERLREYDYGPGAGASIEASGFYKGSRF